ncbi:hypothetical protein DMENIID0001_149520 [Sergentomyia squamirostris]
MELVNKECQTMFRESSAQTKRWRPRKSRATKKEDGQSKKESNKNRIRLMEIIETIYGPNNFPPSVQALLHAVELQLWTLKEFEMSLCQQKRLNYVKRELRRFEYQKEEILCERLEEVLCGQITSIENKRKSLELHVQRELRKNKRKVVNSA